MVGECIESGENGWRMSGECIESGQFSKMAILASTRIWQIRRRVAIAYFLVDHYIEKNEKNIQKISFVWFSHFDYLWRKYLWHFGVNKNFLNWLNLT